MKIRRSNTMIYVFIWTVVFYLLAFLLNKFYFFPIGLIAISLYELKRTEGVKNTKPLSLLTTILLMCQFLHSAGIFMFPFDLSFIYETLNITVPSTTDPFMFLSVILLIVCSLLLIKYTWGSVTKFLAIGLLLGSLIQGYLFLPEIKTILNSQEGQTFVEGQKQRIIDNLNYRLQRELTP